MRNRKNELINFINQCGHRDDELHEIKNDASFRNYYRLLNRDLLIMDADPKKGESIANFEKINKILKTLGFSVPEIIAVDEENGAQRGLLLHDHLRVQHPQWPLSCALW